MPYVGWLMDCNKDPKMRLGKAKSEGIFSVRRIIVLLNNYWFLSDRETLCIYVFVSVFMETIQNIYFCGQIDHDINEMYK